MIRSALLAVLSCCALLLGAADAPRTTRAWLAESYSFYHTAPEGGARVRTTTRATLVVVFEQWIPEADLRARDVVALQSVDGALIAGLRFIEGLGTPHGLSGGVAYWRAALFHVPDDMPEATTHALVRYARTTPTDIVPGADRGDPPTLRPVPLEDRRLELQRLEAGRTVDADGKLGDDAGRRPLAPADASSGFQWLWRNGSLHLEPQVGEENSEIGVAYALRIAVDQAEIPHGFARLELAADGRLTSDEDDPGLQGYAEGALAGKALVLLGRDRVHPAGIRVAGGYEGDERFDRVYGTAQAQLVATLPYLSDIVLGWHSLIGVERHVAPPFVAAGIVYSKTNDDEVVEQNLSRWQIEAGWQVPVTQRIDLRASYRYFDYLKDDIDAQHLVEAGFLYFLDEQRRTAATLSIEEGARAVLGEVGPTVLLGLFLEAF